MQPLNKTIGHFLAFVWLICVGVSTTAFVSQTTYAQGAGRGPIAAARDPETERSSQKSLDAAKFYFYKRKPAKDDKEAAARAKKSVLDRLTEIIDTNANFAHMDQVYFLMAEVYARDNQTEEANKFYSIVVKDYPDSQHHAEARRKLGVTTEKPKEETKPDKKG
ncbi:MAG: hypothetical protein HOP19_29685 [Acidobacteria bacterium]|nr:hypothetical protein [Acidobacteriota bacterium]